MVVRIVVVAALLVANAALAQAATCETLLESLERAFDEASSVVSALTIVQGDRELAYVRSRSFRDGAGELQTEVLERRGANRPGGGGGDGEGQGELDFSCEGHTLTEEPADRLTLELTDMEGPLQGATLAFDRTRRGYLPMSIDVRFQIRILFIPVNGTATTRFSDWAFPPASN